MRGRPQNGASLRRPRSKFTRAKARRFLKILEESGSVKSAADACSVNRATARRWRRQGDEDLQAGTRTLYSEFATGWQEICPRGEATYAQRTSKPSKLTDDITLLIETSLAEGHSRTTAAALVGIHQRTIRAWEKKGEEDVEKGRSNAHTRFMEAMERGEAAFLQLVHRKVIDAAEDGDARTLLNLARLRRPDVLGDAPKKVEVKGEVEHSGSVDVRIQNLTDEELDSAIAETGRILQEAADE